MSVPAHLTKSVDALEFNSLLADWRWLVSESYAPVLMTAFGDLFLRDQSRRIHFLDLMSGELKPVAASEREWQEKCEDQEQRRTWFLGFLFMELKKLHGDLAENQCFGCKTPLSLGGVLNSSNFEPMDIQVHYSVLGQLHRQTKDLPSGTKVQNINIELR